MGIHMTVSEPNTPAPQGDPTAKTAHFQHDWDGDEPLSSTIVSTVATLSGTDPADLEVLYDTLDPDALDALFEPRPDNRRRDDGRVWFSLDGYGITVYGDGFVVVRRLE